MAKKPETSKHTTKKFIARKEREEKQAKIAMIVTGGILGIIALVLAFVLIDNYIVKPNTVLATVGDIKIKAGVFDKNVRYARNNMINQANQMYWNYTKFQSFSPEYAQQFLALAQNNAVELNQADIIGNRVLNDMIDDILIAEEAEKLGITVTDEELETFIQETFGFYPEGSPTPANTATPITMPTRSSLQETLVAPPAIETPEVNENEGEEITTEPTDADIPTEPEEDLPEEPTEVVPTVETTPTTVPTPLPTATPYTKKLYNKDYRDLLRNLNQAGVPKQDVLRILRGAILRTKVMEAIAVDVTNEEEQVWARHILVTSLDEAEAIIERLNAGENFATLAQELSTDQGTKMNGGDLSWFGRGRMVPEFEEASFALENIGDISEPINSVHGWHIIQLLGKGINPVDEQEFEHLKSVYFEEWLDEQRAARTDIVINDKWNDYTPSKPELPQNLFNAIMNPGTP